MSDRYATVEEKRRPWVPFIGFVILAILGVIGYFAAPTVIEWMAKTDYSFGVLTVLPFKFPAEWPEIVPRLIIALAVFMATFPILIIVLFAITPSPKGDLDVDLAEIRKEQKAKRKRRGY
jgi:hypothetical protein